MIISREVCNNDNFDFQGSSFIDLTEGNRSIGNLDTLIENIGV